MMKKYTTVILLLLLFALMSVLAGCRDEENDLSLLGNELSLADSMKEDAAVIAEIVDSEEASAQGNISATQSSIEDNKRPETIFVYVCGAVNSPGVYELYADSRVCDALLAAGDFRDDADSEYLNQAAVLCDGDKLYVPTREETMLGLSGAYSDTGDMDNIGGSQGSDGLININTATVSELKSLPGIGDVKAEAIVSYRETNGKFKSIEDITKVPGIKSGLLEQIRSKICAK